MVIKTVRNKMNIISITDALTNETITREMTAEELTQKAKDTGEATAAAAKIAKEAEDKVSAKTTAQAKLAALGLTADDIKALGL